MLYTVLNIFADYAVLHIVQFIKYICSMLLLCSGDIEVNPGPAFHVACPKCNTQVHIRKKICVCRASFKGGGGHSPPLGKSWPPLKFLATV